MAQAEVQLTNDMMKDIIEQKELKLERLTPALLLVITILGASLRVFQIGSKSLWLDEAFSVWMGWQPLPDMLSWVVRIDQHPPLYYLLLHFWMGLGDSAATVRLLSALAGILTIPVIYLLGQRLVGGRVGLLAAFILALSPFHIHFAQETRMYTLLTLNASLAMLALTRLLTDPRATTESLGRQLLDFYLTQRPAGPGEAPKRSLRAIETDLAWIGYILFTVATLFSHNTAIFFPVAVNLFVFGLMFFCRGATPRKHPYAEGDDRQGAALHPPSLKNWITAQVGVFLLWSPWLVAFVIQSIGVYREFWLPSPDFKSVAWVVRNLLSDFLPGQLPGQSEWTDAIWFLYGLIVGLGFFHLRRQPAHLALLLSLFLTPFAGELLVSLRRPIFHDRTLIWTSLPLYLLLAAGLTQLRYRLFILVALVVLVIVNSLSLYEYFFKIEREQWDDAAAYVAQRVETDDLILFNATWVQIPFDFYFRHFNQPVVKHGAPVDLFDRGILEPRMTPSDLPRLHELSRGHLRVWLVYSHNWYTDPHNLIPTTLAAELKLLERRRFYGLEVHLYGWPAGNKP